MSRITRELREKDSDTLRKELEEYRRELFNLRYKSVTDHIERNSDFRFYRRQIARILTILRERELNEEVER
ncbi:MAG: 50S ribosomal protein L29 [Planctomycetota bacterium]|jgi:large subunit ribosomal protein L29|nr:MAG: 50S ribosomal protein L29 [Planctomycetota bacterium]